MRDAFAVSFGWTLLFGLSGLAIYHTDNELFRYVLSSALVGVRGGIDYLR